MEAWQIIVLAAFGALLVVGWSGSLLMLYGRARAHRAPPERGSPPQQHAGKRLHVALDVAAGDPRDPRVERMMDDAAQRLFAIDAEAELLAFSNRDGHALGWRTRPRPREISTPTLDIMEPHTPAYRRRASRWEAGGDEAASSPPVGATARWLRGREGREAGKPPVPLAERYDLPDAVTAELTRRDDPVELVRAILAASGTTSVVVDADLLMAGDVAVIVLPEHGGTEQLSRAYYSFRGAGAREGLVIALGTVNPIDVRRRESLEPNLVHVGPSAIQRMADAVALGGDPLAFARGPSVHVTG